MHFFLAPSAAFTQWVTHHPDGFVVVVRSRSRGATQCLHDAWCVESRTPFAPCPAPPVRAWACAPDRDELEAWADWERYGLIYCRTCGAEMAKYGPPLEWPSPAVPGLPAVLPRDPHGLGGFAADFVLGGPVASEGVVRADS